MANEAALYAQSPMAEEAKWRASLPPSDQFYVAPKPPVPAPTAQSILLEAANIVAGARNKTHGDKERSFSLIGRFWVDYLEGRPGSGKVSISAQDVAMMMVLLKIARSIQGEPVRDHFVDMAGYAAAGGEIAERS